MMRRRARRHWWLIGAAAVGLALFTYGRVSSYLAWSETLRSAGFVGEMPGPAAGERLLIVAPHPDDETLGCGGLIQRAVQAGAEVHVVVMTNGDASELALIFGERELPSGPRAYVGLGRARQLESLQALHQLGVPSQRVHFLGYPNNGLLALWRPEHWRYSDLYRSPYTRASFSPYATSFTPDAPYCGQQVLLDLMTVLQEVRPTSVFVTAPQDVHPDHWATCAFVRYALATIGVRGGGWAAETNVYGYLVHWPHYPEPARAAPKLALLPPPDLTGGSLEWQRLSLESGMALEKLRAIRGYRSQEPGWARLLLRFARANESFQVLRPAEMKPGVERTWRFPDRIGRGLGGAEVTRLRLTVALDSATVELTTSPRPMSRAGYVGLDIRGWDARGGPLVTTVYVRPNEKAQAGRLRASTAGGGPLAMTVPGPGRIRIPNIRLKPHTLQRGEFVVTCWGSVRDHITAPAVGAVVRLRSDAVTQPE